MLKVGLAGAGWVSQHHLAAWRTLAGQAKVVAIADPALPAARERAAAFDVPAVYASAEEMLAREALDALDIAAPREAHPALVRLGAAHGLAVLCQKPFAPTLAEAEALAKDMAGVRLMVHENWRFRQYYRDAKQWIDEGRIGEVQEGLLQVLTSGMLPGADGKRPALERQPFFASLDRMIVSELLIHHLDTMRFLLGPLHITDVRMGRSCPDIVGEDNALIGLRAASGAGAVVFGNMAAAGYPVAIEDELLVVGSVGTLRFRGAVLECFGPRPMRKEYDLAACYAGSYAAAISHFVERLRENRGFETSPEDNLETLRLVEDAYRRAGRG